MLNVLLEYSFKNCVPFIIKYITKVDGAIKDYVEDLDLALPMDNLIEWNSD